MIYGYLTNSPWIGTVTFRNNGQTVMTTSRQYDSANRLRQIESSTNAMTLSSHTYDYNLAGQPPGLEVGDQNGIVGESWPAYGAQSKCGLLPWLKRRPSELDL